MVTRLYSASSNRDGVVGDSSGLEVKECNYYDYGQRIIIRFSDANFRKKLVQYAADIVNNNKIGYSMSLTIGKNGKYTNDSRYGLWYQLVEKKKKPKSITTKVNTDCSQMVSCCMWLAGLKHLNMWTATGNMVGNVTNAAKKDGLKVKFIKFKKQSDLKSGDILLNEKRHVTICK